MTTDKTIFGLRFKSDHALVPMPDELKAFLDSPKLPGGQTLHRDDVAKYLGLLSDVKAYELRRQDSGAQESFEERMFYGVLAHSHFASPALQAAVEEYKYQLHALAALDFKKPSAFIKSAEQEMSKLNPKKKEEAARYQRFQMMIDERKQALEGLEKRWDALAEEMYHIVQYVRENLAKIEKLCEASIAVLVSEQIDRKKESGLIEDIKAQMKERLRESLRRGTITREHLETAKAEVAEISRRIANSMRSDVYALTGLYEDLHEHAKKTISALDDLVSKFAPRRTDIEEDRRVFSEIEKVLVSLVQDYGFRMKPAENRQQAEQDPIITENRKEVLDHLFDRLQN